MQLEDMLEQSVLLPGTWTPWPSRKPRRIEWVGEAVTDVARTEGHLGHLENSCYPYQMMIRLTLSLYPGFMCWWTAHTHTHTSTDRDTKLKQTHTQAYANIYRQTRTETHIYRQTDRRKA